MASDKKQQLRSLPSLTELLEHERVQDWLGRTSRALVLAVLREVVETERDTILRDGADLEAGCSLSREEYVGGLLTKAEQLLRSYATPGLRRVINATGIVLHTGLGRAPLSPAALQAITEGASGYCNLELDLPSGQRGNRTSQLSELIARLVQSEAATVVNNNAAAVVLALNTLGKGREVIVSRGQLIEIGGSFRLPEIMQASGAVLREVGTTNKTRIEDFEAAINEHSALILHVHTSNYRVVGFAESPSPEALATLAQERGIGSMEDLGSGCLIDLMEFGLPHEPTVAGSVRAGFDVVCFSGDKLLGGPQAGIIVGRKKFIGAIERNPLYRTYRADKLALLSLEATLRAWQDPVRAAGEVPVLAMLTAPIEVLGRRARSLCEILQAETGERFHVCSDIGFAGGGSMPAVEIPTVVVQWRPTCWSASQIVGLLRQCEVPVIARIREEAVCFDVRTIFDSDFAELAAAVAQIVQDADQ